MNKKLIILSAIVYFGTGSVFAYSGINIDKSISICDSISNIGGGGAINPPDVFNPDNIDQSKCKQQFWGADDVSTFITIAALWLPLILFHG
jgi:hypothetical protein